MALIGRLCSVTHGLSRITPQLRLRYICETKRHISAKTKDDVFMGTVRASSSMRQLAPLLEGLPLHTTHKQLNGTFAILVLLLTPELAHLATDNALPQALLRHAEGGIPVSLDVVTGVVDGISDCGFGFSFFLQATGEPLHESSQGAARSGAQRPGYIDFYQSDQDCNRLCNVRLPLAQTIFSTGKVSTLVHSLLVRGNHEKSMEVKAQKHLEWQRIPLPPVGHHTTLNANLTALTPFRVVDECVGNIVRSLSTGKGLSDTDGQPASLELETAVSQYFRTTGITPQSIAVWALIAPNHVFLNDVYTTPAVSNSLSTFLNMSETQIQRDWQNQSLCKGERFSESIQTILNHGGRLCRVLSGGGGWGKKAGLLSLDPDTFYDTREIRGEQGWAFDFSSSSTTAMTDVSMFLGQSVTRGEHVMFLTQRESQCTAQCTGSTFSPSSRIVFGSTVTDRDESNVTHDVRKHVASFTPGEFGATSRLGLSLTWNAPMDGRSRSKFDVPLSTIQLSGVS